MNVYLSNTKKRAEMAAWAEKRAGHWTAPDEGGQGFPDEAIFGVCDFLNALPGVCTLQSCSGHIVDSVDAESRTIEHYTYPANLWLWLDRHMFKKFLANAEKLAARSPIESVQTLHLPGRRVVSIDWNGAKLAEGGRLVCEFFRRLHEWNTGGHRAPVSSRSMRL